MAEAAVAGALLQIGFEGAFKLIGKTARITIFCNSLCKKLKETLNGLKPTIDEICKLSSESSSQTWLRSIEDFQGKLGDGLQLVNKCERTSSLNLYKKFRYGKRMQKLEKEIGSFIQTQILPHILLNEKKAPDYSDKLDELCEEMKLMTSKIARNTDENSLLHRLIFDNTGNCAEQQQNGSFFVPNMPRSVVGFDKFVMELKELVLDNQVNVVGVTGKGGMGKSTLALSLSHNHQVKDYFGNRVIYITVGEAQNLLEILETMWENIVGGPKPHFRNEEDAHNKLQLEISTRKNQRTLVVLDDIWSKSKLEKLLFEGEGYKTLVTTRDENTIPKQHSTRLYKLPLLQEEHALSLFCFSAFGESTIPRTHDKELVKQVQAECKGLPLALKVIGCSLRDQPSPIWKSAKKKLSRGESISKYHKEDLLERLKTSIDVLDDDQKQCFLDLGAFPEGRNTSVNALLDIWVHVRGMEWEDAFVVLWEFAARNLLELKSDPWSSRDSYECVYELSFSQHDVMRDLSLYLAIQDNKIHFRRLYMAQNSNCEADRDQLSKAQIVSFHTGEMNDKQWPQIEFPEAEALVLFFTAREFCIPTFLNTMKKLKVLIIHNYSSQRAKLNGLDAFLPLSQLKTLQLERLTVPPLYEYCGTLKSLEKLSLSLCEGLGNMNGLGWNQFFNFPKLLEINLDHCSDLEELSAGICYLNTLKKLSITNCHLLCKLPDDLGKLALLQVLRLCACPGLTTLPSSISRLRQLEFLDISLCGSLKEFPVGFYELSSLKKLDMRECSRLRHVPQTLEKLKSLKYVICDKNNEQQLIPIGKGNYTTEITVEVVEELFSLDWLYN